MLLTAPALPETTPAVLEIGLLLLLAVAAGWLARRIGLPAVLGYLVVGLIVSPFTPGYVADRRQLQILADVGVVLLLFEVGIEIDPIRLIRNRTAVLWAAPAQVLLTAVVVGGAGLALGLAVSGAALVGLSVAMSSSVVVINITRSRRRTTNRATEEALLSWSVTQDLIGVALAARDRVLRPRIETAVRGGRPGGWFPDSGRRRRLGIAARAPTPPCRARPLPHAFGRQWPGAGGTWRELLRRSARAGSVRVGAIGESPAAAEARRRIVPFRDLFAVLFFVLLGSLIDPSALPRALPWIGFLLAAVIVAKAIPAAGLSRIARLRDVRHWQLGVGLGQVGEFGFVLAGILLARGLIPSELFMAMLSTVALTIAASAIVVQVGRRPASVPA